MYVYTLFENISIVPNVLVSNENVKIGKANFKSYCIFDFFFLILCIWIRHEDIGGKAHTLNPWMYTNAAPKNTPQQEVCFETIETLLHFILNIYFSIFFFLAGWRQPQERKQTSHRLLWPPPPQHWPLQPIHVPLPRGVRLPHPAREAVFFPLPAAVRAQLPLHPLPLQAPLGLHGPPQPVPHRGPVPRHTPARRQKKMRRGICYPQQKSVPRGQLSDWGERSPHPAAHRVRVFFFFLSLIILYLLGLEQICRLGKVNTSFVYYRFSFREFQFKNK